MKLNLLTPGQNIFPVQSPLSTALHLTNRRSSIESFRIRPLSVDIHPACTGYNLHYLKTVCLTPRVNYAIYGYIEIGIPPDHSEFERDEMGFVPNKMLNKIFDFEGDTLSMVLTGGAFGCCHFRGFTSIVDRFRKETAAGRIINLHIHIPIDLIYGTIDDISQNKYADYIRKDTGITLFKWRSLKSMRDVFLTANPDVDWVKAR